MKRFQFQLEPVLNYKNQTLDALMAELSEAQMIAAAQEKLRDEAVQRLADYDAEFAEKRAAGFTNLEAMEYEAGQQVLEQRVRREEQLLAQRRRELEECLNHPCVAAIGETGLDYHLPRREQHRLRQKLWFLYQLRLARRKKLPLVLHIRQADADALRILKRFGKGLSGGVCHCFLGSAELAGRYTALGFKLGIGGALLAEAPETQGLEQAVTAAALEDLVLETDGPYVKPNCPAIPRKQLRKARNTSLILPAVAARIAELKNVPLEEVYRVTSANAVKLFGQPGERE